MGTAGRSGRCTFLDPIQNETLAVHPPLEKLSVAMAGIPRSRGRCSRNLLGSHGLGSTRSRDQRVRLLVYSPVSVRVFLPFGDQARYDHACDEAEIPAQESS